MTPSTAECLRADHAFERIYRRHVGDVYRYSLAVLREPTDAVDVTQVTFLNACNAFERGERPGNSLNWLIGIAHEVCRRRSAAAHRVDAPDERAAEEQPTGGDIRRALGRLAFEQRAALVMRELEGRSYAEIAEILGLSQNGVETLLFQARRGLREELEGTLTCTQAERAISRRADTRLTRAERTALRVHLRECDECARLASAERAQRKAFDALASTPVPSSLTALFAAEGALASGLALKARVLLVTGALATGASQSGVKPSGAPVGSHAAQRQAAWTAEKPLSERPPSTQDKPDRKIFPRPASH